MFTDLFYPTDVRGLYDTYVSQNRLRSFVILNCYYNNVSDIKCSLGIRNVNRHLNINDLDIYSLYRIM